MVQISITSRGLYICGSTLQQWNINCAKWRIPKLPLWWVSFTIINNAPFHRLWVGSSLHADMNYGLRSTSIGTWVLTDTGKEKQLPFSISAKPYQAVTAVDRTVPLINAFLFKENNAICLIYNDRAIGDLLLFPITERNTYTLHMYRGGEICLMLHY